MGSNTETRKEAIRHNQNELLYQGVKYSVAGSLAAAGVAVYVFGPMAESFLAVCIWFCCLYAVYLLRALDYRLFRRAATSQNDVHHWAKRFNAGAMASATAWSSSMWLIFPQDNAAHQVLLVLTLGGVAGGALASLPYDTKLSNAFQILIFTSVETRLLVDRSEFSLELALFSCFVFGFLLSCGREVGKNYLDLLRLRQDSQETNLTLIRTTEQMAGLGYWQWDLESTTLKMSSYLQKMLGFKTQEVKVKHCYNIMHQDDRLRVENSCHRVLDTREDTEVEYRMADPLTGDFTDPRHMRMVLKLLSDSEGKDTLLGAVQDITDIKSAEKKIYSMAYYDKLTTLANRALFHERLETEINLAAVREQKFAIIYIDLDDFKGVNDSYGHECGDNYLKHFSLFLKSIVRRTDLSARMGGDEFCILIGDISDPDYVEKTAQRCLSYCDQVVHLGNHRVHPQLSIGVAIFPNDGKRVDDLIKCADMAMYTVKQAGKHSYAFYNVEMATETMERVRLEADLRQALVNEEFELWYQPKINILLDELMGVEALIRWRHPDKGLIPPDLFIRTAERVGMIKEIGEWVFTNACEQLRQWNDQGLVLSMAVNISGDHFVADGFCEFIFSTIEKYKVQYDDIEIEITESLSRNPEEHTLICHELRSKGVRIAIDDFGTGYSSLSVLGNLEVDTLKIDKSFIDRMVGDPAGLLMVNSIVDLSLGLGYSIVAEGVETADQLALLYERNCPYVQGYYFSRPVEHTKIPELIHKDWAALRAA